MHESELSKRLIDHLRKDPNVIVFKIHGHAMQMPGIPDFYIATDKFSGWIETKGAKTATTELQKTYIRKLKKLGVPAYILRFKTDRHFVFEDEDGNELWNYTFSTWKEGAEKFLFTLYFLEERDNPMSPRSEVNKAREYEIRRMLRIVHPDMNMNSINTLIAEGYTAYLNAAISTLQKQVQDLIANGEQRKEDNVCGPRTDPSMPPLI